MVQRYTIHSLDLPGVEYADDAHVELSYKGAPTIYELEKEIQSGVHTNVDGEVGCPYCGCVDMFYREFNTKGRRYRCNSCFYNSESQYESVKSQKDITLSSFGLVYICPICEEPMDSYNKATILRHLKKHEDANKVSEAEDAWHPTCPHCYGKVRSEGHGWVRCMFCGFSWEAPDLFRADEYGLWTQDQLDAPDAPWTPEVISPIFPLKGYEKPVEVVRAELQKNLVGQEIRMWHESHDPGFYHDFGFSEPQPSGTWGKVTGISEVNPNRPWVIGVWVTITKGGSAKHPIGSRVWFHVKDSHFPNSLYSGWHEGDYLKAEGEEALYWATRTNMLDAESYEIIRWLKVLRDENPEDWDDIDWEDDEPLPHDDWHDEIDWEAEEPYEKDPRWLDHYYHQHKHKYGKDTRWPTTRDDILPQQGIAADYWTNVKKRLAKSPNQVRMRKGGLFLNWLHTFGPTNEGMRRLFKFFGIPLPRPKKQKHWDRPKKPKREPYNPYDPKPLDWNPYRQPPSDPFKWDVNK